MKSKYKTSELIEYLDNLYGMAEWESEHTGYVKDIKDKPKYEEIKNRLLELDKITKLIEDNI